MSFRPWTDSERSCIEDNLKCVREQLATLRGSEMALEQQLRDGAWVCDVDWRSEREKWEGQRAVREKGVEIMLAKMIDSFSGEYAFLSNFYPTRVLLGRNEYPTVEHAYQAAKTNDPVHRAVIRRARAPAQARQLGRSSLIEHRSDWDSVKVDVMLGLLRQKFSDPVLKAKLLATGNAELVEGNTWGDTFWGKVNGKGDNMLGILLHVVRHELRLGEQAAQAGEQVEEELPY